MNKRIDAHQHFWKFDPVRDSWIDESMQKIQRNFLPDDLLPLLIENKFQGCIAVEAHQSEEQTNFLIDLASKNDFIKGIVGWVDLRSSTVSERLHHFSQHEIIKGFRHVVQAEADDFMDRKDFRNGIVALAEFGFIYEILIFHRQLPAAIDLVNRFPNQKFIIDHIAKPDIKSGNIDSWKKNMDEIAKADNVFCKVSGMVTEANWYSWKPEDLKPYLDVVFENFTTERVVFGSDWPVSDLAAKYSEVVETSEQYLSQFTAIEQNKFWFENANSFYKLNLSQ